MSQLHPQVISLSPRDYDALVEAIMNPAPPNERLREATRWYRELIVE